ncbi:MAG: rod shape-determining protein [Pseudomonadales bacterium]|nr:rod shape-determining protein [Pseudomonadales bacterium]
MKIPLLSKINKKIGIDLGSQNTRIWIEGKGVVYQEPTCIAVEKNNENVLAVGLEAVEMDGRVGEHINVIYPILGGEIFDDLAIKAYLKILLNKFVGSILMLNPIIMVSVPVLSSQADREIVTEIIYSLGAAEVYTIAQPLAASIGAGVPIADTSGTFFLHMGEGVVEGVVISLGSIISLASGQYSGAYFSERIIFFLRENFSLKISKSVSEQIVRDVISINKKNSLEKMIGGQDTKTENPKEIKISSNDFLPETLLFLEKIEDLLRDLLSKMPPELTVDVIDKGLLISGGLANIANIEDYFVEKLGIPVAVVDNPESVVIEGIGTALTHLSLFKKSLGYTE